MTDKKANYPGNATWSVETIPYHAIERETVRDDVLLLYTLASASFVEITSDIYTRNLVEFFRHDPEIVQWLAHSWENEEKQHGVALQRYVQTAWPDFDWDGVYDAFLSEFRAYCTPEGLEPTRAREMASRCIVEMGTASYYTTLSRLSPDPVLSDLARRIAEDEVRHYKHFYRYFRRFQAKEKTGRIAVSRALLSRLGKIDGEDSRVAMKHLYLAANPGGRFDKIVLRNLRRGSRDLIRPHFPHRMCVRMLLKPLGLGPRAQHLVAPVCETLARQLVP